MKSQSADVVRDRILDYVNGYAGGFELTSRARGFMMGFINGILRQNGVDPERVDGWRQLILSYLFAESLGVKEITSSKQLGEAQMYALYEWVRPFKNEDDGTWVSGSADFDRELMVLYDHVRQSSDDLLEALGWNVIGT